MTTPTIELEEHFGPNRIRLGDKFKQLEKESIILSPFFLIVRCDMRGGTKFTKNLQKPFDKKFTDAMKSMQEKMHSIYRPTLSYTQSDEISFIFFEAKNDVLFNLRRDKIISLTAAQVSTYFNYFMKSNFSVFDCRVFNVDSQITCFEYLLWRHYYDCQTNSIQQIARQFYSQKELNNINIRNIYELLKKKTKIEDYPIENINGVFTKSIKIMKEGYNPLTKEHVNVERTSLKSESFLMKKDFSNSFFDSLKNETEI